jgi:serine protease Do
MKKPVKIIAAAAVFGLVAGTVFQGVEYAGNQIWGTTIEDSGTDSQIKLSTTSVVNGTSSSGSTDVSDIVEQVLPSLVSIDITATVQTNSFFGQQTTESSGSGSGIIIADKDDKLYIATNNHVVEDADSVKINFYDETVAEAQVKGTDSSTDLAVVEVDKSKLSDDTLKQIKVATIGDSSQTKVGEQAIAIGNALGYGTSVTVGYISARDREIDTEDSTSVKLFQTDAAINPGNSGGALVNHNGEVIGINSSKFASEEVEGMGFAIPMETAEPVLTELMNEKEISEDKQAYLGITGRDITSEYVQAYGLPEGIYVSEVTSGSPAEKAGIRQGYIITAVNEKETKTLEALKERLDKIEAGTSGTITVQVASGGDYEEKTLDVTFGTRTSEN